MSIDSDVCQIELVLRSGRLTGDLLEESQRSNAVSTSAIGDCCWVLKSAGLRKLSIVYPH